MLKISKISFPGLGIGEFSVQSVAFTIKIGGESFEIAWYALIITLGIILAVAYLIWRAKPVGLTVDDIIDFVIFGVPSGIIGARIYFVLSKIDQYDSFLEMINIRNGGIAIYGALIGGAIAVYVTSKVKKIPFLVIADCATPGIILAQAIGRWGNFVNGEAFGTVTDIFCRMGLNNDNTGFHTLYVHPTFLYECLWNVLGFVLINVFYKKRQYDGQIFLAVFGWYGLGRAFIEGLRTDSLYTNLFGLEFRTSQVLAAIIFIASATLLIYFAIKKPQKPLYHHVSTKKPKKEK